ncbi:hypothetical protein BUE80_DR008755 [Diplocarpon rosae]|nr:hypothetical protein BUE80_DR008755 [Diplocarpon rosae]
MGPNEKARDIQGGSKRSKNAADNENLPAKGRPARVVLKSDTAKMSSRITLRTLRAKPGSSNSVRELSTRRELLSTPAKAPSASLRGTPSSRTRDQAQNKASPASVSKTANKPVLRAITDSKGGSFSQRSPKVQTPTSNREDKLIVSKPSITKYLDSTPSSDDESDKENAPPLKPSAARTSTNQISGARLTNPHYQYSNETLLRILENMKISSTRSSDSDPDLPGDELENSGQAGDSLFYADGESSDEDLESKMRDLLTRRETNRRMRRPEVKSVKWDPAILDCGPLTSITNKLMVDTNKTANLPSQQRVKRSTKGWEINFEGLAEMASELKKGDRRRLQKLLEALKHVESSDDSTVIIKRRKDRKQSSKDEAAIAPGTAKATKEGTSSSKLNPAAPVYRNFTDIKARMSPQKENLPQGGQWPLNVRRKRPHSASDETLESQDIAKASKYIPPALRARNILPTLSTKQEPIWINTSRPLQFFTEKSDDGQGLGAQLPSLCNDWLLNSSVDADITLQSAIEAQDRQMALDDQKLGLQVQPLVSTWLPEKYPLTGKVIPPAAPSPLSKPSRSGKNASEIQQKLEELLLYQKEKKVFEQRYIAQDMPAASVKTFESSK